MTEQERADQLAYQIDRLLAGEPLPENVPLLTLADELTRTAAQPSPESMVRFEQQLDRWFRSPRPLVRRIPPLTAVAAALAAVVVIVVAAVGVRLITSVPTPTPTITVTIISTVTRLTATLTPTITSSLAPTATIVPSSTLTALPTNTVAPTQLPLVTTMVTAVAPTPSATLIVFANIIVNGQIDSLQPPDLVTVLEQTIQVSGGLAGLCLGDMVHIQVTVNLQGVYQTTRPAIKVLTSACLHPPAPTPNTGNSGGKSGGNGDHHNTHHDD